jgi:23S rRNA pseudouridine1911/1915/1917 synthase
MTRSQIKARKARLFVRGKEIKISTRLKVGDPVEIRWIPEPQHSFEPENLNVHIVFEDKNVIVFDKEQGMVTHPAHGHWQGTLANAALWLAKERHSPGEPPRGGIVHRLDKDTSGIIIVALTVEAHAHLAQQFKIHAARKEYFAIVRGFPPNEAGRIENLLARDPNDRKKFSVTQNLGKHSITDYKVISTYTIAGGGKYAFLALYPRTGRTHQLRVHLSTLGCPILGDPIYGKKDRYFPEATLMLHARRLKILLPREKEPRVFRAELPQRYKDFFERIEKIGRI